MSKNKSLIEDLMEFLNASPTAWHAVDCMISQLSKKGFKELKESASWDIKTGGAYFVQRNRSSLCAFVIPQDAPQSVRLLASHTDSPGLKLKPMPEIRKHQSILLGVEVYGAPLLTSWLNRDLGLAGRVIYFDKENDLREELVRLDDYPMVIPQLAIHLDREVNEKGLLLNKQEHLNVLAALDNRELIDHSYLETILKEKYNFNRLVDFDLFFYPLEKARLLGFGQQLLASYRLDSLSSVHAILYALVNSMEALQDEIKMAIFWDNEEVGSHTAQGADSPFFNQIMERLMWLLKVNPEDYFRLINRSHCVSVDLAHAVHPSYGEKHDPQHQPLLGKGIVLKHNAQQRYATDARSSIPIQVMADIKQIPLQKFVSRNDIPSGSTIGPLHASLSGMHAVDIGCGQLSMHSCREIMACQDHIWMCKLLQELYETSEWPRVNE